MLIPRLGQRRSEMTLEYLFVLEKRKCLEHVGGHITRNQYQLKGAGQAKFVMLRPYVKENISITVYHGGVHPQNKTESRTDQ